MLKLLIGLSSLILLTSCTNDKPKPETKKFQLVNHEISNEQVLAVTSVTTGQKKDLQITYTIKNNDLYVECFPRDYSFRKEGKIKDKLEGEVSVFIDGERVDKMKSASFILKDLSVGEHKIKVEYRATNSYISSKEFMINIK